MEHWAVESVRRFAIKTNAIYALPRNVPTNYAPINFFDQ